MKPSVVPRVAVADIMTTASDLQKRRRGNTSKFRNDVFGFAPKYDVVEASKNWLTVAGIGLREPSITVNGPNGSTQIAIFDPDNLR